MNIKNSIGQRLAETRKNKGWSQMDLAEKSGFNEASISNWETGVHMPKLQEAKVLENILAAPAPYFLGLSDCGEM